MNFYRNRRHIIIHWLWLLFKLQSSLIVSNSQVHISDVIITPHKYAELQIEFILTHKVKGKVVENLYSTSKSSTIMQWAYSVKQLPMQLFCQSSHPKATYNMLQGSQIIKPRTHYPQLLRQTRTHTHYYRASRLSVQRTASRINTQLQNKHPKRKSRMLKPFFETKLIVKIKYYAIPNKDSITHHTQCHTHLYFL